MNANFIVFCGEIMSIYRTEKNGHILLRVSDGHEHVGFFIASCVLRAYYTHKKHGFRPPCPEKRMGLLTSLKLVCRVRD